MKLFLNSNKEARNYIEELYSLGSPLFAEEICLKEIISYELQKYKNQLRIGSLEIIGELPFFSSSKSRDIISEFLVHLWSSIFEDFQKNIGLMIKFTLKTDNCIIPIEFNLKGAPIKFYMEIDSYDQNTTDILYNISHEFLHIDQYLSGDLRVKEGLIFYQGHSYPFSENSFEEWENFDMHHEKDAYAQEESIVDLFKEDVSTHVFSESLLKVIRSQVENLEISESLICIKEGL